MTAAPMIARCFRHQHPEAYGFPAVPSVSVPIGLLYGTDHIVASTEVLPEEPMGWPGALWSEYP